MRRLRLGAGPQELAHEVPLQQVDGPETGDLLVLSWGGTATYAAKLKGISGLVVDGGVRDREEMVEHGLPVFARHLVPTTGRGRIRVARGARFASSRSSVASSSPWIAA